MLSTLKSSQYAIDVICLTAPKSETYTNIQQIPTSFNSVELQYFLIILYLRYI